MSPERFRALAPTEAVRAEPSFPPAPENTREIPASHLYPGDHLIYDGCVRTIKNKSVAGGSVYFTLVGGHTANYDQTDTVEIPA
jgi:hypothetical protein